MKIVLQKVKQASVQVNHQTVGHIGHGFFSQSVIQTLSYFDIFEYPLTREELFHFLWQGQEGLKYGEFLVLLDQEMKENLAGIVERQGGYYFFSGKSEYIAKRERKVLYTEEKLAIAQRAAQKLRYLPFVKALFVCNQLPVGVKKGSDIDVFIVIKRGRMWMTRAFITAVLSFFLLRRSNKSITDLICLSFYVTDDNLDLSSICISAPDVYQAYWTSQLIPVYDPHNFQVQIQEKNTWVQKYLRHGFCSYTLLERWKVQDFWLSRGIKKSLEKLLGGWMGGLFEKHIRFLQLKKMKINERTARPFSNKSVVISDTMLKFHENDRKEYFQGEWEKRWKPFANV